MREIKLINYTINYSINNINHMQALKSIIIIKKKASVEKKPIERYLFIFLFFREFQLMKLLEILSAELIGTHVSFYSFK